MKKPEPNKLLEQLKQRKNWWAAVKKLVVNTGIPEVLLVACLCIARYLENSDFSYPSEIILNIVLLAVPVLIVFGIYRLLLKDALAAHVAALPMSYMLYAYSYGWGWLRQIVGKLTPGGLTSFEHAVWQVVCLFILFGLVGFGVKLLNTKTPIQKLPLLKLLIFVICFVFASQAIKVALRLWDIRRDLSYSSTSTLGQPKRAAASKPNVYYFVFDRYANQDTLQNIYGYDNSAFLQNLQNDGFVLRGNDAYSNYPFTTQSVSSTLSAGYLKDLGDKFKNSSVGFQTAFPYRSILNDSPVTKAFQSSGYQYNQVSSWWDFTRIIHGADTNPSKSFRLRLLGHNYWATDLQRDIINKSILSPILLKGISLSKTTIVQYQLDRSPTQNFYAQKEAISNIAKDSATQTKPQLTVAHFLSPHDPYVFDADGNPVKYSQDRNDWGKDEYDKYVAQLTFINSQITEMSNTIRSRDPNAIIIIQSDEGPYPKSFRGTLKNGHFYNPAKLSLPEMRQKFGVLAAYYLPGKDPEEVTANMTSSVNTFRYILNDYLGYDLPMLPDCQFSAGNKFNLFTYQLVSGMLRGTAEPDACNAYQ